MVLSEHRKDLATDRMLSPSSVMRRRASAIWSSVRRRRRPGGRLSRRARSKLARIRSLVLST